MKTRDIRIWILAAGLSAQLTATPPPEATGTAAEQLQKLYPPMVMSPDMVSVVHPGTILITKKPNIATIHQGLLAFSNNYKSGQIKHALVSELYVSSQPAAAGAPLAVGQGVYLLRMEVRNAAKSPSIVLTVQTCGACDLTLGVAEIARATVTFPLQKGALDGGDISSIRQMISEVFDIAAAPAAPAAQPGAMQAPAPPVNSLTTPPAAQEQTTTDIGVGQTLENVVAILGQPERKAVAGPRQIYFYKDMKVTFLDGKVSDVQ